VAGFVRPVPRVLGAVAIGVLAAAVVGILAERSSESIGPSDVRLTDAQSAYSRFGDTKGAGAGEIARFMLFGSTSTTKAIGHAVLLCTYVGSNERSCNGTYILPRGTLQTAGVLRTRLLYTQAVVGGTGLYDNARGTLTVTAKTIKPRREILLFRLTG
jgi:hypothetical protein